MKTRPCAKLNIGLNIVGRRADGYHDIETVFYPIPLCDELEIEEADADSFSLSGIPIVGNVEGSPATMGAQGFGNVEQNLVVKAVSLLRSEGFGIPPLSIRLEKNIPSGAGLGGGSSDAAFTVRMLNEMFTLGLSTEEMKRMVATLGADCAFFIEAKPAYAEGIGDVLSPIELDLSGLFLVLVKPDDVVSTREAYSRTTPHVPQLSLREAVRCDITAWRDTVVNDFEQSVFPLHPEIAALKQSLYEQGAVYASMSGSGSSVFALFREPISVRTPHFLYTSLL